MKKEQRTGLDSIRAVAQYNLYIWENNHPLHLHNNQILQLEKTILKKKADDKNTQKISPELLKVDS